MVLRPISAARWCLRLALAALLAWIGYSGWTYPAIATYGYVSSDGGFDALEVPAKGRSFERVCERFALYAARRPGVALYRTTPARTDNLFCLYDVYTHPRWELPYASP